MQKHKYSDSRLKNSLGGGTHLGIPLIFLCMLALAVPAFATHTSTVDLQPEWTVPGAVNDYTVEFCNDAGSVEDIDEVRIYRNMVYTDFVCEEKDGWDLYFISAKQACLYVSTDGTSPNYDIEPDECEVFEFSAKAPVSSTQCGLVWDFETRDRTQPDPGSIEYLNDTTNIDEAPPVTSKVYGDPHYPAGINTGAPYPHWITTGTPVTLTAVDELPGCAIGVDKLYWRNTLVGNEYCESESACQNAEGTGEFTEVAGDTTTIYKPEESCHLIEFYSIDKLENTEETNRQCVYVEDQAPKTIKKVGEPNIFVGDGFDYWVSQDTEITMDCDDTWSNEAPHPVDNEQVCYRILLDGSVQVDWTCTDPAKTIKFGEDSEHQLDFYCVDALGNESEIDSELFKVDGRPPEIKKTMIGDDHLGECPPGANPQEPCYVADNGENGVHVAVSDPDPTGMGCNVDQTTCTYELWWENKLIDSGVFGEGGVEIIFHEDSEHTLIINCEDALKNRMPTDTEVFLVDSTPPVTTKSYEGPQYPNPTIEGVTPYPHWITSATLVHLSAEDEKVGVNKIYWRNTFVEDRYCYTEYSGCQNAEGSGDFVEYTGPFNKPKDSCHLIEYYAVDKLGNVEEVKKQCVFVDNLVPDMNKVVGEPMVEKNDSIYISTQTPITLSCWDVEPHPSDHVSLWYRYRFADDCADLELADWVEWIDPTGPEVEKTIYFEQDSCHELEYYCEDALGNETTHKFEIDIVDTQKPVIDKKVVGPQIPCPPEETIVVNGTEPMDCFQIDGTTKIEVDAIDPDPHPVDQVTCDWDYVVLDGQKTGSGATGVAPPFTIIFPEESTHILTIICRDALGNTVTDVEKFIVDHTPPETTKTYTGPQFPLDGGYPKWINSSTTVHMSATDAIGPHDSGVKDTKYRVSLVADGYCDEDTKVEVCDDAVGNDDLGGWMSYIDPFNIPQESCHLIEYYSVDNVDKKEDTKKQCVYVDNSAPDPVKTVGEPRTKWNPTEGEITTLEYKYLADACWDTIDCWKVTLLTPITLGCNDPDPHPVDHSTVCFQVEVDGDDATQAYCGDMDLEDGYCCLTDETKEFYFREETEHNLEYYCVDALGNEGPTDDEKFKVEGRAFEIQLNKKWNLISVPFVLLNDNIEEVLETVIEEGEVKEVKDKIDSVWTYNAMEDKWYVYHPGQPELPISNLFTMEPGIGYWIAAYEDAVMTLGGSLFSPTVTPPDRELKKGWNLIGYYGTDGILGYDGPDISNGAEAGCKLWSLGPSILDKGWWALLSYWEPYNPTPGPWNTHGLQPGLDYNDRMDPGAGYWIGVLDEGYIYGYRTCESGGP